jgi:predicted GNAT family N-acyltransferase
MNAGMTVDVATVAEMPTVLRLRYEVYTLDQGLDPRIDADDKDAIATHVLARDKSGKPVGTGRVFERDGRWYIGRMVVLGSERGTGIGRDLVNALERIAIDRGARSIELHAQVQAIGFYAKLGYEPFGERDMGAGIPHQWMRKLIPTSE